MSHVRRTPQRRHGRMVRKKKSRKWLPILIIILLFASIVAGIVLVILSSP